MNVFGTWNIGDLLCLFGIRANTFFAENVTAEWDFRLTKLALLDTKLETVLLNAAEDFEQHLAMFFLAPPSQNDVVDESEGSFDAAEHLGHDFLKNSRCCLDTRLQTVHVEETQVGVDRE